MSFDKTCRPGNGPEADKADTASALSAREYSNCFNDMSPLSQSGRTGERGLVLHPGNPTASQAGHNDEKERTRIVAAGKGVGNVRNHRLSAGSGPSAIDPNVIVEEWFNIHAAQPNFS